MLFVVPFFVRRRKWGEVEFDEIRCSVDGISLLVATSWRRFLVQFVGKTGALYSFNMVIGVHLIFVESVGNSRFAY